MKPKQVRAYLLTDGKLIPEKELEKHAVKKESGQVPKDADSWYRHDNLVQPPYDPSALLELAESNAVHGACCRQIATDVCGRGWTLDPIEADKGDSKEADKAYEFLEHPNPKQSLRHILKAAEYDYQAVGWFGLEFVRDTAGFELYHIPAQTLRIHKNGWAYRHSWKAYAKDKRWFKLFGTEQSLHRKTGEVRKEGFGEEEANEIFVQNNLTSTSTYYGIPASIPALGAIIGMGNVRDYSLSFFMNHAVPEFVIVIENADKLEDEKASIEFIQRTLTERHQGPTNEHRTAVFTTPEGVTFRIETLGVQIRDASFRLYRTDMADEILMAHRMPPYRIGIARTGQLGGSSAPETTEIYKASVVTPRQLDLAEMVNAILWGPLEIETWQFRFNELDIRDKNAEREWVKALFSMGAVNPNWIRAKHDLGEPYPEGYQFYVNNLPVGELRPGDVKKAVTGENGQRLVETLYMLRKALRDELATRNTNRH